MSVSLKPAHLAGMTPIMSTSVPTAREMWTRSAPHQFRFAQRYAANAEFHEVERTFGSLLTDLAIHYSAQYDALAPIEIETIRAALLCEVLPRPSVDPFDGRTRGA